MIARAALAVGCVLAAAAPARAAPVAEQGVVEAAHARWTAAGDLIVTDVIVRAADGRRVTVTEHGGRVDGIGMVVSHREHDFRPGDAVALVAAPDGMRLRRLASRAAPAAGADGARYGLQRTSRSGRSLFHPSGCLTFVYDERGTARLEGEWAAFDAAFDAWEEASAPQVCGNVRFTRELRPNPPDGRDGVNTIRFRDDSWCRPASGSEPAVCHSPSAVAVTRTIYVDDPASPRDGEILEVDIEINTIDFVLGVDGNATVIDLESVAAHEIGHALGLAHSCGLEDGAWPTDAAGTLVPSCESAGGDALAATMYFQVQPGMLGMRTPEAGDLAGLCPVIDVVCTPDVSGGCAIGVRDDGDGRRGLLGVLVASGLVGYGLRRRRR